MTLDPTQGGRPDLADIRHALKIGKARCLKSQRRIFALAEIALEELEAALRSAKGGLETGYYTQEMSAILNALVPDATPEEKP